GHDPGVSVIDNTFGNPACPDDFVEGVDVLVAGGDDQRAAPGVEVGEVGLDGVSEHGLAVATAHPAATVVQIQGGGVSDSQSQSRLGLVGVCAHAHHLLQLNCAGGAGDVGEQATGGH